MPQPSSPPELRPGPEVEASFVTFRLADREHDLSGVRLRQEIKQLRQEREILAKAAAWFARETGSIPPRSSSS